MMDQKLKERVFGALVVVAIAVIFVPMLFDSEPEESSKVINTSELNTDRLSNPDIIALEATFEQTPELKSTSDKIVAQQDVSDKPSHIQPMLKTNDHSQKVVKTHSLAANSVKTQQALNEKSQSSTSKSSESVPKFKETNHQASNQAHTPAPIISENQNTQKSTKVSANKSQNQTPIRSAEIPIATLTDDDFMASNDETGMTSFRSAHLQKKQVLAANNQNLPTSKPLNELNSKVKETTHKKSNIKTAGQFEKGWAVQIGAFANQSNAKALQKQIKQQGYDVFLQEVSGTNRTLTKVMVGPKPHRSQANEIKMQLEANIQLKGVVIEYDPLV